MRGEFYDQVPRDRGANLQYRLDVRRRAAKDRGFARACQVACRHDVLFWLSAFCWVYEPRVIFDASGHILPKMVPMIPWPHQEPVILELRKQLGVRDVGVEKSRGEGLSWIAVLMALHDWLYDDMAKIGMASKDELSADDPNNMDSLFAKIDWELAKLPSWMAGKKDADWVRNLSAHSLVNRRNGAQINAFASKATTSVGGRYKWFFIDELAKWDAGKDEDFMTAVRSTTNSRLIVSTPEGTTNAYYKFMHTPSNAVRLRVHWSQNPAKNRGLYRFEKGAPVAVDPASNPLPACYDPPDQDVLEMFYDLRARGYKLEGMERSPWYDQECYRGDSNPFSIAQELDIDYGGSTYRVFGPEFFEKADASIRAPRVRGVMDFARETLEPDFQETEDGPVLLWCRLHDGEPPKRTYVVGVDPAAGTGGSYSSNSAVVVVDAISCEQVLEWATNVVEPGDFADYCIAIARWFHDAYLCWEANGPTGAAFTKRVVARRYENVYMRTSLTKRGRRRSKAPGFQTTHGQDGTKGIMFSQFRQAVVHEGMAVRSRDAVRECGEYIWDKGKIVNVHVASAQDDSAAGEAHGDRVIALCMADQARRDRPLPAPERQIHEIPYGSAAWRDQWHEDRQRVAEDDWDDREVWDLAHPGLRLAA